MNSDLILVPIEETYRPVPNMEYRIIFKLECFKMILQLIHTNYLSKKTKYIISQLHKDLRKQYFSVLSIDNHAWLWKAGNNLSELEQDFKHKIKQLKYGEAVEFIDLMKEVKPIRVSWRAIELQW